MQIVTDCHKSLTNTYVLRTFLYEICINYAVKST